MQVSPTLVYDHPTPSAIAQFLLQRVAGDRDGDVVSQLSRLEASLNRLDADDSTIAQVSGRLEAMLRGIGERRGRKADADDDLDSASADELVDMIQREFGRGGEQ
jgi:hypothetical protein